MSIRIDDLTVTFKNGVTAVDHVDLEIPHGIFGLLGENGAGKSTLLKIIAGVEQYDSGSITKIPHLVIHYLPQQPDMQAGNTVLQQVFLGASEELRQMKEYEAKSILTKLGISDFQQDVSTLSGGQKKRVAIASALATPCDLLILDEPTKGIDVGAKIEIYRMIYDIANQGISVIVVSSELPEVIGLSDRVIVMRNKRIVGEINRKDANEEVILQHAMLEKVGDWDEKQYQK